MDQIDPPVSPNDTSVENPGRRELLKALAAGGVVTASSLLPGEWVKPVIEAGYLPAHAQASPTPSSTSTPTSTPISTPTSTPTPTPTTPAPIVYSLMCDAEPDPENENFIYNITATVLATGGASVSNIEVQYRAEVLPAGPVTPFIRNNFLTNSSGVADLGDFEYCQSGLPGNEEVSYQIVISFVDQATYGNGTCTLGPYTSFGC